MAIGFVSKPPLGVQLDWTNPINRGLVGCWIFNEGGGTRANDLSGNGNHGLLIGNIVPNSGFELGTSTPSDWGTLTEATATYTWETPGRDGATGHNVAIEMTPRVGGQIGDWRSSPRLRVKASQSYTLAGWMKTQNVTGATGANIVIAWYDTTDTWIAQDVASPAFIQGTTAWTYYKNSSATSPVNAVYARIQLRLYDAIGKVWFDDITFISGVEPEPFSSSLGWKNGLTFDGANDYINVGNISLAGLYAFSVVSRIRLNTLTAQNDILNKETLADFPEYAFHITSAGKLVFWFSTANTALGWGTPVGSNTVLSSGIWYHVVGIYNGANITYYINGEKDTSSPARTGTPYSLNSETRIGSDKPIWHAFNGSIDEVRIYNRTLSEGEVKILYSRPYSMFRPSKILKQEIYPDKSYEY